MQLFINNENIDIQLQDEEYLVDVLRAVEEEIQNSKAVISSIRVNNENIDFSNENWQNIHIQNIKTIHIEADSSELIRKKLIINILQYLHSIYKLSEESENSIQIEQFLSDETLVQDIEQILSHIDTLVIGTTQKLGNMLQNAFSLLGLFETPPQFIFNAQARDILKQSIEILETYQSINPTQQWQEITHALLEEIATIKEMTITDHVQYSVSISTHIKHIQQWLVIIKKPVEQTIDIQAYTQTYDEYIKKFSILFKDIESAIGHTDWVTVADIIGYEIAPLLESYAKQLLDTYGNKHE